MHRYFLIQQPIAMAYKGKFKLDSMTTTVNHGIVVVTETIENTSWTRKKKHKRLFKSQFVVQFVRHKIQKGHRR